LDGQTGTFGRVFDDGALFRENVVGVYHREIADEVLQAGAYGVLNTLVGLFHPQDDLAGLLVGE